MALDFPSSPTVGQVYPDPAVTGVPQYVWDGSVWTTGTYVPAGFVLKSGDTMTGLLTLSGPPTVDLHASTKKYVDDRVVSPATFVQKSGDTMTGILTLSGPPTVDLHASTKKYVDDRINVLPTAFVQKLGDTMAGLLTLSGPPTVDLHAATKKYVDDHVTSLPTGTAGYHIEGMGTGIASVYKGFLQAGTGAVERTWQAKARDVFNVKDFGAVGNGSADDTPAIQAALAAATAVGGGKVEMPRGTFKISNTLTVADNVALVGAGSSMTTITTAVSSITVIFMSGLYPQIRGFAIDMTVTPTNGTSVQAYGTGTFSFTIDDILIKNCWNGMVFQGSSNASRMSIGYVSNVKIWNFRSIGMYFQYVNDIFVHNALVYQKDISFNVGNYALYMTDNCEAVNFNSCDFVGGANSMLMGSSTPTVHGQRPAYNSFTACYFDSAAYGSSIFAGVETSFVNCWFATGGLGGSTTGSGLNLVASDTMMFANCRFHTNARHGCVVEAGASRTGFFNCAFTDNSILAGVGVGHGLLIGDNVNGVEVIGGFARNGEYPSSQGYGIAIGAGVTNLTILGTDVNGNYSGPIACGTQIGTPNCTIKDCKGFTTESRGVTTIPNGAPSATVSHGLNGAPQSVVCTMIDSGNGPQAVGGFIPRVLAVSASTFVFDIGVLASAARQFSWEAKL